MWPLGASSANGLKKLPANPLRFALQFLDGDLPQRHAPTAATCLCKASPVLAATLNHPATPLHHSAHGAAQSTTRSWLTAVCSTHAQRLQLALPQRAIVDHAYCLLYVLHAIDLARVRLLTFLIQKK